MYILERIKDIEVIRFNIRTQETLCLNKGLLPVPLRNKVLDFSAIKLFCSLRMLMLNRVHCKEILNKCEIDDQSDLNICIVSRALSFRDNYWIKQVGSNESW